MPAGVKGTELPLLLNIGDSMHCLSNRRFLSTPHRVVDRTPAGETQTQRTALIYFALAPYDALLEPHAPPGPSGPARIDAYIAGTRSHAYSTAPEEERAAFDAWCALGNGRDYTTGPRCSHVAFCARPRDVR